MTTGRINQVTILARRAEAKGYPRRGRSQALPEGMGTPERAQPQAPNPRERAGGERPIQLPPLSSPRGGPLRERSGRTAAKPHRLRPPRGGDRQPVMPREEQLRATAYPQACGEDGSRSQPSTDHKGARCRKTTGLRFPQQSRGDLTDVRVGVLTIGFRATSARLKERHAPDEVLTRVDVAGRRLGIISGYYGTARRVPQAPPRLIRADNGGASGPAPWQE